MIKIKKNRIENQCFNVALFILSLGQSNLPMYVFLIKKIVQRATDINQFLFTYMQVSLSSFYVKMTKQVFNISYICPFI